MSKVYYEKKAPITTKVYEEDGHLVMTVASEADNVEMFLGFEYGPNDVKAAKWLWDFAQKAIYDAPYSLTAILQIAAEADDADEPLAASGNWGGAEGNFSSLLAVAGEHVGYTLELLSVGTWGEAQIDLGRAGRAKTERLSALVEQFEHELKDIVYVVKHYCIDNGI